MRGPYPEGCSGVDRGRPPPPYAPGVVRAIDYALARRAVLAELAAGTRSREDVCDAHPELLRAARNVGEPAGEPCPVCGGGELVLVSYVFGDGLRRANGRCVSDPGELESLQARHDEFDRFVVEVCVSCGWNHLGRRELRGRRHAVAEAAASRRAPGGRAGRGPAAGSASDQSEGGRQG